MAGRDMRGMRLALYDDGGSVLPRVTLGEGVGVTMLCRTAKDFISNVNGMIDGATNRPARPWVLYLL